MAVIVLSNNQAFNPGADLWVIPDFNNSKIASQLDWYNNFLMGKTLRKNPFVISSEVTQILQETELPRQEITVNDHDHLMISTNQQFPNRWTVMVWYEQDSTSWCKKIYELYLHLKKPTLRIFLPTNLSMNTFVEAWRSVSSDEDFSIVVEN